LFKAVSFFVPLTLARSLRVGLVSSLTLLAIVVGLVVRLSHAQGAIVLALMFGVAGAIGLVAWYAHAVSGIRQYEGLVQRLEAEAADSEALQRLTASIHASRSVDELSAAVLDFVRAVFPDSAGAVATWSAEQKLEVLTTWGRRGAVEKTGSCYAIRDGQTFVSDNADRGFRCQHVERTYDGPYMCFPILGAAGTAGVLHLRYAGGSAAADVQRWRHLGEAAAAGIRTGLETIELHDLLRTQSLLDPLTGLNNRRALFDHARRVHARAIGDAGTYSVIMADVDRFKALNDTLGHSAGDAILVTFARHLQRHIRSDDFACRYGGEEFVIVMPDVSREVASERAEGMRAALRSLRTSVPRSVWRLSASFGVATFPFDGNDFAEILRRADEAMYVAKTAGRDRVTSWNPRSRLA